MAVNASMLDVNNTTDTDREKRWFKKEASDFLVIIKAVQSKSQMLNLRWYNNHSSHLFYRLAYIFVIA